MLKCLTRKVDPTGLSIFRIIYSLVLMYQVWHLFVFRKLIFMFVNLQLLNLAMIIWFILSVCLCIGFSTRIVTIANYIISVVLFSNIPTFNYDFDKIMITANLLLIFLPVSECLSLDSLLRKKTSSKGISRVRYVSQLNYLIPILLLLALPYLDSTFHKIGSDNWMQGIGLWAPMSMPQMVNKSVTKIAFVMDSRIIMMLMNYVVLLFEFLFVFLLWSQKMRRILLIIGIGLHLGILIIFPIPGFALGVLSVYGLLIPTETWSGIFGRDHSQSVAASNHKPLTQDIFSLPIRERIVLMVAVVYMVIQSAFIANYLIMSVKQHNVKQATGQEYMPELESGSVYRSVQWVLGGLQEILGVGGHAVFVDKHVRGYEHIFAVTYLSENNADPIWLPLIQESGFPGRYLADRMWSRWTAYVVGANPYPQVLKIEIPRYLRYWCHREQVNCVEGKFYVKMRRVKAPDKWVAGILEQQADSSWDNIGWVELIDDTFVIKPMKEDR